MTPQITLPAGYREKMSLDLQHDRKLNRHIFCFSALTVIAMGYYGNTVRPIARYFRGDFDQLAYMFLGTLLYIVLHETVHGIFMHLFSGVSAHLKTSGIIPMAQSEVYFDRPRYLIIAMAPILIWGTVLAVLCQHFRGTEWFWTFYFIEIMNISGAAPDLYMAAKFFRLPREMLVRDNGTVLTVYVKA